MKAELPIFAALLLVAIALPGCTAPAKKTSTPTTPAATNARLEEPELPPELKQRINKRLGELARIEYLTRYGINEQFVDILLQDTGQLANVLSYLKYQSGASTDPKVRMQLQRIEIEKYVELGITGSLLDEFPRIFTYWTAYDARDRRDIVHALGYSKHPDALEVLLSALSDPDRRVRVAAAEALGKLKDKRAVEPLVKALCNADRSTRDEIGRFNRKIYTVREAAARALGRIRDARAVEPLIVALGDTLWFVQEAAAEALGEIKHMKGVKPLIKLLDDKFKFVSRAASKSLIKIGEPALELLKAAVAKEKDEKKKAKLREIIEKITKE